MVWMRSSSYWTMPHSFLILLTTFSWLFRQMEGKFRRILLCDSIVSRVRHLSVSDCSSRHRRGTTTRYKGVRSLLSAASSLWRTVSYSWHSARLCPYAVPRPEQFLPHWGQPQPSHLDNTAICIMPLQLERPKWTLRSYSVTDLYVFTARSSFL